MKRYVIEKIIVWLFIILEASKDGDTKVKQLNA